MPGKTEQTSARLAADAARLAVRLSLLIDAIEAEPVSRDKVEGDAKIIGVLARAGAGVASFQAAAERGGRRGARGEVLDADAFEPGEGDMMEKDDRAAGEREPQHVERVRADIEARFADLAARLESEGLIDGMLAVDCPPSGDDLVQWPAPEPAAA